MTNTAHILAAIETRVKQQFPARDDVSVADIAACDSAVIAAFGSGARVKVRNTAYDETRTGTVSRTTGWRPALLLMRRRNAHGSSDVLGPNDRIVAVWNGRRYVDTAGTVGGAK